MSYNDYNDECEDEEFEVEFEEDEVEEETDSEGKPPAQIALEILAVYAYAPRVARGARFLQKKVPGWTDKIIGEQLDLGSVYQCVLGQLAANSAIRSAGYDLRVNGYDPPTYGDAVRALSIDGPEYGFEKDDSEGGPQSILRGLGGDAGVSTDWIGYGTLNELWAEAIRLTIEGEKVTAKKLRRAFGITW